MPPEGDLAAQAGNTSSDFVRKLYKMLEDPAYHSVVRWGNEGDSFVVLENEKFTKTILPKHFKHSNFASFVRQLNKYDFHKVRQNDDSGQSPYGPDAWEFKHPEFHQNNKDNLDNIRRKAPAPRKAPVADDSFMATQQANLLNETVSATQHQVQALQNQYDRLLQANKALFDEVVNLHKMMKAQSQVHHELLSHLSTIDERRRNSRHSAHSSHSSHSGQFHHAPLGMLPDSADEPAAELRRAREILNAIPPEPVLDRELERLNAMFQAGSPPESATSSVMYASGSAPLALQDPLGPDMQHLVYPVGQTAGIDPFHADHINNIPYTRPLSNPNPMAEAPAQITPPPSKEAGGSLWGSTKPRILLVEDDRVCMRIGSKFLTQVDCKVDTAKDGSEAVAKVNEDPEQYDLIFMDIIMPVFDGVSATACIRLVSPRVPIVAMTSNIRGEDIATYFHWGMNDVLAKPFTKDGMVRILRKHLPHLLKNPPTGSSSEDLMMSAGPGGHAVSAYSNAAGMTLSPLSAGPPNLPPSCGPMKYETTPIQSPATTTTTSWHSPGTITNASPHMDGGAFLGNATNGGQQMVLASGSTQRPPGFHGGPPPPPMRGRVDGLPSDDRPEKRQRVYGPGQAQYSH